nr:unnamed protein product [Digitaria exilis]
MARALASGGATAAGFVQTPWLAVLGVALLSVWAITLAVLLCGDSGSSDRGTTLEQLQVAAPAVPAAEVEEEAVAAEVAVGAAEVAEVARG